MGQTRRAFLAAGSAWLAGVASMPGLGQTPAGRPFNRTVLVDLARTIASRPHEAPGAQLPGSVAGLDFDAWREIRFKPDASLLRPPASRIRLQAFHLGHLFKRPVRLNLVAGGLATPIPYAASDFDYGPITFDPALPADLGYAGWRFNYPVNVPDRFDELISFIGSSYFRLLGRDQVYGLSARGLSIGTGLLDNNEEFPFFREFWFETPQVSGRPDDDRIIFHALLDSPSVAGAYSFELRPGTVATVDVTATLFARKALDHVGIAPLTSMYFIGENDRHYNDRNRYDDYRPEMHDSDGLQIHKEDGSWLWRPLRNPQIQELSYFQARNIRGFGLMQRDRTFSHYQDIELAYQSRPSYWIEPKGDWGDGRIELVELATRDETADNVIVAWLPVAPLQPLEPVTYAYRISSGLDFARLNRLGRVAHTFTAPAGALGSREHRHPGSRRFIVDFAGGMIDDALAAKQVPELVVSVKGGKLLRSFTAPNPFVNGVRAFIDVKGNPVDTIHMRAALEAGGQPVSETWVYRWKVE